MTAKETSPRSAANSSARRIARDDGYGSWGQTFWSPFRPPPRPATDRPPMPSARTTVKTVSTSRRVLALPTPGSLGGRAALGGGQFGIETHVGQRLGLVQIEAPVGDLAVAEGDRVRVARLDLQVVALALGSGVQQRDDAIARRQQAEVLDLDV